MPKKRRVLTMPVVVMATGFAAMSWLYLAGLFGYIPLPSRVSVYVEDAMIVFGVYFLASLFINATSWRISALFVDAHAEERILFSKIYTWGVYILSTSFILVKLGASFQQTALSLTILATGFAFAIRDMIISYLAWFVLLVKKPFHIGDCIRIGDEEGRVIHIGTFYVKLDESLSDGHFIKVPNKVFLDKPIRNFGHESARFTLTIPADHIPEKEELDAIEGDLRRVAGNDAALLFNAGEKKLFAQIEYTCSYEFRKVIRDRIIREIGNKLKKEKIYRFLQVSQPLNARLRSPAK